MVEWDRAQVHVMTHACTMVLRCLKAFVLDTPNGTAIFRLKEHIQRLFDSAKIYWMEMPFDKAAIEQACCDIVTKNDMKARICVHWHSSVTWVGRVAKERRG